MKPIDKIKNLKEQLTRKKRELEDIDFKIEQLIKERTKRGLESSKNFGLNTRLEMDLQKEKDLKEITSRIDRLNVFKRDILGEISNLQREIETLNEPRLIKEREQAKKQFDKLTIEFLEVLPNLHRIGKELISLNKEYNFTLSSNLKSKKLFEYKKTIKGDKPNLRQLINNSIGILGIGCWNHYTIEG